MPSRLTISSRPCSSGLEPSIATAIRLPSGDQHAEAVPFPVGENATAILPVKIDDPDALPLLQLQRAVAVEQAPAVRREARVERISTLSDLALIRCHRAA